MYNCWFVCMYLHTAECEVLQTLDLSWNHIRRKGSAAIADGLKVSSVVSVFQCNMPSHDVYACMLRWPMCVVHVAITGCCY